jgi:ABC-2 type transport system permease protein
VTAGGDRLTAPPPPPSSSAPAGSIYDIGYRGYDGPRLGRRHAFATLFGGGVRATFGLGRSGRAKILPAFCLAFPAITALVIVAMNAFASRFGISDMGAIPGHPDMAGSVGVFATILVAAQAPELLGRDVRYRVLSLYFSRALLREDYALAKLAALSAAVLIMLFVPHLILTVGAVLLTTDVIGALGREAGRWPAILGSTVVTAVATSGVALVVAAFIARRAYATVTIFAVFIVPGIIAAVVITLQLGEASRYLVLLDLGTVLDAANAWFFGVAPSAGVWPITGLPVSLGLGASIVIALGASAVLVHRYRTIVA